MVNDCVEDDGVEVEVALCCFFPVLSKASDVGTSDVPPKRRTFV